MRKLNKVAKFFVWLLVLVFIIAPFNFSQFNLQRISASWQDSGGRVIIDHDETWKKTDNLFFTKSVIIRNNATLTIEKGAAVTFSQGGDIFIPSLNLESGRIVAEGTREEKIIFTAATDDDRYAINFSPDSTSDPSFLRYVEISKGGYMPSLIRNNNFFFKTASAARGVFAFNYYSGKAHLENVEFKNNNFGDISVDVSIESNNADSYLEISNSNFSNEEAVYSKFTCPWLYDEVADLEYPDPSCPKRVYLKNNWYGHASGPTTEDLLFTLGGKVSGDYFLDGFRTNSLIVDPVIVIPGILGSAQFGEEKEWKLDPITYTYADFVSSLEKNGYEKGKTIFEFPYDWRKSNLDTAVDLKNKINDVLESAKVSRVDLVAHSMGGLVARQYIESADYANNVDQLVTMGTPQKGAPWSYLLWEGGEGFFRIKERVLKKMLTHEAKENGYDDLQRYIQAKIVSVKELLPDYDYLFDSGGGAKEYPQNNFLENLNFSANVANLKKVDFTNIIGDLNNDQSTISKIRVVPSTIDGKWEHGMPENFYDENGDRGLEYGRGDETVPKASAEGIPSDQKFEIDSAHSDLPTTAQCEVIKELSGLTECRHVANVYIPSIFMINVFSPIDIQVISPSGQKIGKDFVTGEFLNEIEGAYYSGYDSLTEFVTIPNPEDGEYKILTQGTGSGSYRIESTKISENPADPKIFTESTAAISGDAEAGKMEEKIVTIQGGDVTTEEQEVKDVEGPVISVQSPEENKIYLNNQILPVQFSAEDNVSAPDKIAMQKYYDGNIITSNSIDLSLKNLGAHKIKIIAKDEAGNKSQKEISFTVSADLQSIRDNVNHYSELGLIPNKGKKAEILAHLSLLEKIIDLRGQIEKSALRPKIKAILLAELSRLVDLEIRNIISKIGKMKDAQIFAEARNLLIESLKSL
jgi:pimeloyl-ACP methyl ester carboxylesterase